MLFEPRDTPTVPWKGTNSVLHQRTLATSVSFSQDGCVSKGMDAVIKNSFWVLSHLDRLETKLCFSFGFHLLIWTYMTTTISLWWGTKQLIRTLEQLVCSKNTAELGTGTKSLDMFRQATGTKRSLVNIDGIVLYLHVLLFYIAILFHLFIHHFINFREMWSTTQVPMSPFTPLLYQVNLDPFLLSLLLSSWRCPTKWCVDMKESPQTVCALAAWQ